MSTRYARFVLWIALAFLLPLPFYLIETGAVPAVRIAMLAGVMLAMVAVEGAQGAAGIAAWLLGLQALLYLLVLWLAAGGLARLVARGSPRALALLVVGVVALGVAAASSFDIYRTPFRTESLRGDLFDVFE
jgi:hypothetical protein